MSNFKQIFYDTADINVQTGTVYTASLSDAFNYIATNNASKNIIFMMHTQLISVQFNCPL